MGHHVTRRCLLGGASRAMQDRGIGCHAEYMSSTVSSRTPRDAKPIEPEACHCGPDAEPGAEWHISQRSPEPYKEGVRAWASRNTKRHAEVSRDADLGLQT